MKFFCKICIFLFVEIIGIFAQVSMKGGCQNYNPVLGFQTEKFMGKWYEVKRYENIFQLDDDCVILDYILNKNGSITEIATQAALREKTKITTESISVLSYPERNPLPAIFNITSDDDMDDYDFSVLETDYTDYAIVWSCSDTQPSNRLELLWILSRTTELSEGAKEKVDAIVKKQFDADFLRPTIQSKNQCLY